MTQPHAHCRCMNLKGECPNKHFADCDICSPNGNELRRQEEEKRMSLIDVGYFPKQTIPNGLLIRFEGETDISTEYAYADILRGKRFYSKPEDPRKILAIYRQI